MTSPRIVLFSLLAALPVAAHASPQAPGLAASVGQMIFGLAIVIALLFACLWLIRKLSGPRRASGNLRILGAASVGARERVVMVEVAGTVLVLGVAPGRVNTLHTLPAETVVNAAGTEAPTAAAPLSGGFADRLRKVLDQRK